MARDAGRSSQVNHADKHQDAAQLLTGCAATAILAESRTMSLEWENYHIIAGVIHGHFHRV